MLLTKSLSQPETQEKTSKTRSISAENYDKVHALKIPHFKSNMGGFDEN